MNDYRWRYFRCYFEGEDLRATIKPGPYGGYLLEVDALALDHKWWPRISHEYKNERGALRAMETRFRGAVWEELKHD